jgi:hypothetical protein
LRPQWLTVASVSDFALITNSTALPLPIASTSIPIAGFFYIAPIVLTLFFIYFHLSLQRVWEMLADLPAVFPDGVPLDKRAYPWNCGVVFRLLKGRRRFIASLTPDDCL